MTPRKYSPSDSLKQFYIPESKDVIIKGNIPLIRISQIAKNNTNFLLSYFFFGLSSKIIREKNVNGEFYN